MNAKNNEIPPTESDLRAAVQAHLDLTTDMPAGSRRLEQFVLVVTYTEEVATAKGVETVGGLNVFTNVSDAGTVFRTLGLGRDAVEPSVPRYVEQSTYTSSETVLEKVDPADVAPDLR